MEQAILYDPNKEREKIESILDDLLDSFEQCAALHGAAPTISAYLTFADMLRDAFIVRMN